MAPRSRRRTPPKFDPIEEQDTQAGPTAEGSEKGPDGDTGAEFGSMEVDYGASEAQQNDESEGPGAFLFLRSSLERPESERASRAIEATFVVDLEQDEADQEVDPDVRVELETTVEEDRSAQPPTATGETEAQAPGPSRNRLAAVAD